MLSLATSVQYPTSLFETALGLSVIITCSFPLFFCNVDSNLQIHSKMSQADGGRCQVKGDDAFCFCTFIHVMVIIIPPSYRPHHACMCVWS